jgi:SprT-like family
MLEAEPNKAIKTYVEKDGPKDWEWQPQAKDLYEMSNVFRMYFFSQLRPDQYTMPQPLVAVEDLDVRTLGAYYLRENELGLKYQISLNAKWIHRPKWELYETLVHEMVHLYQENAPESEGLGKCKRGYHNQKFVEICEDAGLHPALGLGWHLRPADGQFARLMARYEVERPAHAEGAKVEPGSKKSWWDDDRGGKPKGGSTLVLYTCATCTRKPACKIRAGRRDLEIGCRICSGDFRVATS